MGAGATIHQHFQSVSASSLPVPVGLGMLMSAYRWSAVLPSLLGSRIMLDMREAVCEQGSASYLLETFSEPVWRTAVDSEADRDDTR